METSKIIVDFLKVFISWPVLIFILLLLFKKDVSKIINKLSERVKSAKVGGHEFEFFTTIEEESKIAATLEKISEENPELLKTSLKEAGADQNTFEEYRENVRSRVRPVQTVLKDLKFDVGDVDGVAGPQTKSAVRQFQEAHGLYPDGIIGTQTLGKIAEVRNMK